MPPHLSPVLPTLAWTLLHFIWQGCVLAAAFWIVMLVLRRSSASSRYLAGCITLAMMALAPMATFACLWQRQQSMVEVWSHWSQFAPAGASPAVDRLSLTVVCIWLLGAASCILWVAGGWVQTRRLRSLPALELDRDLQARVDRLASMLGVRCLVRMVNHASVAAPLTIGALKPVILLPASMLSGLTPAQLEAILAHEMAHIRRMDFLVNLLQAALEAVLFYHPAVWWVSRQVRIEREYCCDDLAAAVCGNPITYARALAQLESLRGDAPRLGLSSQGGSLMKRIARLIDATSPSRAPSRLAGAAWGSTLALLAATSTALALQAPPETAPPAPVPETDEIFEHVEGAPVDDSDISLAWLMLAGQQEGPAENAAPALSQLAESAQGVYTLQQPQDLQFVEGDCLFRPAIALHIEPRIAIGHGLRLDLALQQAIDPERMPSDGLVQAAKMAYPFNLLELMPWVAPEAHEVLVKPAVEPPLAAVIYSRFIDAQQQAAPEPVHATGLTYLNWVRARQAAAADQADVQVLSEAPLISRFYRTQPSEGRVRYLQYLTAVRQAAAAAEAEAQPEPAEEAANGFVTYEIRVIPTVRAHSLELTFKALGEAAANPAATGADEAKPIETTTPEPAPTPTPSQPSQPKP